MLWLWQPPQPEELGRSIAVGQVTVRESDRNGTAFHANPVYSFPQSATAASPVAGRGLVLSSAGARVC